MATAAAANATALERSATPTAPTSRVSRTQPKKGGTTVSHRGLGWLIWYEIDFVVPEPTASDTISTRRVVLGFSQVWGFWDVVRWPCGIR